MAFIGMRHVVAAPLSANTAGQEPTYSAGQVIGKAITGNLSITRNANPLYADDIVAEDDNGIVAMSLELGLDDLDEEAQVTLGLKKKVQGTGESDATYYDTSDSAHEVGVGYIRVRRKGGVTTYQGVWIYKSLFSMEAENSQTKAEGIEWQTPTITGRCAGLSITGTGEATFRKIKNFNTESAATTWLDGLAGI